MEKKVLIIGAGIAGLSAGCYARMNGYDTHIVEAHTQPGGLCTGWKRQGYALDGCIHWLTGSGPANPFYTIWEELGAVQGRPMVDFDYFVRFRDKEKTLWLYTDVDRLERHMKDIAPADGDRIEEMCGLIRRLAGFGLPLDKPAELMGLWDGIRVMRRIRPFMKDLMSAGGTTIGRFAERFSDPFLRECIRNALYDAELPLAALVMTLGPMSRRAAGFPVGGSLAFSKSIADRYCALGGRLSLGSRVERIIERDGTARGVRLADGTEISADVVIAACDMTETYNSLLGGRKMDPVHEELFRERIMDPCVLVTLGVSMDVKAEGRGLGEAFKLPRPVTIGGREVSWFNWKSFAFDPSLEPPGKSVLGSFFMADWKYWEPLAQDRAAYVAEKKRIAETCVEALATVFPDLRSHIEMIDVATPLTFQRYTSTWRGSYMTWNLSGDFRRRHRFVPKTVPGLDGVYLAGMWTNPPGGLPGAALAGREVVQLLCARDRKKFAAAKP